MTQTIAKPTEAEIDAVELELHRALSDEPYGSRPCGYWRPLAEQLLEVAAEARPHPADLLARGDASDAEIRAAVGATFREHVEEPLTGDELKARVCECGHTAYWHGDPNGVGSCEDGADCRCQALRLDPVASHTARFEQALGGGRR